ncbi:MAG TPA: VOC family protein [Streptosporangiaceae bacterium]
MSTREDYPAGVPCWVDTNQPDPADAARFYSGLFGWQTEDAMPPDAGAHYYMARIGGRDVAAISSQPPGAPPQAMWNTYIRVESADDAAARVREAGGCSPSPSTCLTRGGWACSPIPRARSFAGGSPDRTAARRRSTSMAL